MMQYLDSLHRSANLGIIMMKLMTHRGRILKELRETVFLNVDLQIHTWAMKQFSLQAAIIMSKLPKLKLLFLSSFCQKETDFLCQLFHISSEHVCQYLLAVFVQLPKHSIHLVLIYLLHAVQTGKLLPGNCLISQYFSQGNCLCVIHQFYGLPFPDFRKQKHAQYSVTHRAGSLQNCR